jgi:hypothetical protein
MPLDAVNEMNGTIWKEQPMRVPQTRTTLRTHNKVRQVPVAAPVLHTQKSAATIAVLYDAHASRKPSPAGCPQPLAATVAELTTCALAQELYRTACFYNKQMPDKKKGHTCTDSQTK